MPTNRPRPTRLHHDFETFSALDLRKTGSDVYARHPSTEVLMCAYAINSGPVKQWVPAEGQLMPAELEDAVRDERVLKLAWNKPFEWAIWKHVLGIEIPHGQWRDPMVLALSLSLPGALEKVGSILGLAEEYRKQTAGTNLINWFCKPRKATKTRPAGQVHWWQQPKRWADFLAYNRADVEAERKIWLNLSPYDLSDEEWALWVLDQDINQRGIPINLRMAENAIDLREDLIAMRMKELRKITGLANPNSGAQLLPWLQDQGYIFDDLKAGHVRRALDLFDPHVHLPGLKRALELRLEISRTSTKKFAAYVSHADREAGVVRNCLQFAGAGRTGRWCLAEGAPVRVLRREGVLDVPIQCVRPDDFVWDGVEWVNHEGVVFSGEKVVTEYDGVVATPEHVVYISDTEAVTLGEAARRGLSLWAGNDGLFSLPDHGADRAALHRLHGAGACRAPSAARNAGASREAARAAAGCDAPLGRRALPDQGALSDAGFGRGLAYGGEVYRVLPLGGASALQRLSRRGGRRLGGARGVAAAAGRPGVGCPLPAGAVGGRPEQRGASGQLEHVRGTGFGVAQGEPTGGVESGVPGVEDRMSGQAAEARRAGDLARPVCLQSQGQDACCMGGAERGREGCLGREDQRVGHAGVGRDRRGDSAGAARSVGAGSRGSRGEKVRTYDLINAGPRNRFMAFGKIVSNSGRVVQPQNLARPVPGLDGLDWSTTEGGWQKVTGGTQILAAEHVEKLEARGLDLLYANPIDVLSGAVRTVIQAPDGWVFVDADLRAIENVVLGYLAGDDKILRVFRDGLDPYIDFATHMYRRPYAELWVEYKAGNKAKRTVAKPGVLGAGYMLGAGKQWENRKTGEIEASGLLGYAWNMGVRLTPEESALSVKVWRETYTRVVEYWREIEGAAKKCLRSGRPAEAGPVRFDRLGPFLRMRLPSGRHLYYVRPRVEDVMKPWGEVGPSLTYEGLDERSQWNRISTHPGKVVENADQATARDILAHGMRLADRRGVPIAFHVHDQIIGLAREDDADRLLRILIESMAERPGWAPDLPLHAAGHISKHFVKD